MCSIVKSCEVKGICPTFTLLQLCAYMHASTERPIKKPISIFRKFLYHYLYCLTEHRVENILPLSCWPQDLSLDANNDAIEIIRLYYRPYFPCPSLSCELFELNSNIDFKEIPSTLKVSNTGPLLKMVSAFPFS